MPCSRFPVPPFTFSATDEDVIDHVKRVGAWYFGPETTELVAGLDAGQELISQGDTLKALWPAILTDALQGLKRHDRREWHSDAGIDFESFFNRESLGMERLTKVLDAFRQFEGLMYGARPERYRDHVAHTFRVWAIGHGLLQELLGGRFAVGEPLGTAIREQEWACVWAIAALCHDIGYPLTALDQINEKTGEALGPQGLYPAGNLRYAFSARVRPLHDTFLRLMSSKLVCAPPGVRRSHKPYATHLQNKYYLKFVNSFDSLDHGVVSALVVGKSLVYFLESDFCQDSHDALSTEDARQFLIRREILRAIAAHTCPEIYHLRFDTLSFLLFIVDELQCWGRPTLEQMRSGFESSGDDRVGIRRFEPDHIHIAVHAKGSWENCQRAAEHQLRNLRKRLRLAVDSPQLRGLAFQYDVTCTDDGKGRSLCMRDGEIATSAIP